VDPAGAIFAVLAAPGATGAVATGGTSTFVDDFAGAA